MLRSYSTFYSFALLSCALVLCVAGCSSSDGATEASSVDGATASSTGLDASDNSTGGSGVAATDAADGADGATAVDGASGIDGLDGTTGTPSTDGNNTGVDGTTGATGTTGSDGSTNGTDGSDGTTGVSTTGGVGEHCTSAADCDGNVCITLSEGYCSQKGCTAGSCPAGSECYTFTNEDTYCLKLCSSNADCKFDQICDTDGTCWPGETNPPATGDGSIGSACTQDSDCKDAGATCYPENFNGEHTGFLNGYCILFGCQVGGCPVGSTCQEVTSDGSTACVASCQATTDCRFEEGYACYQGGICFPGCGATSGGATCPTNYACDAEAQECVPACTAGSCPAGTVCKDDGTCGDPPCTPGSCGAGMICADSGVCVPDLDGGPGVGPGPVCNELPPMDCSGSLSQCGAVTQFTPVNGTGYTNYPLNGETWNNQYRSFCREDMQVLIKWATAFVDCKANGWGGGNGYPLGRRYSEADGAIPGTSVGAGHPSGTHVDGYDMDIAYYSNAGTNNYLKPVCDHIIGGSDQHHCTSEPYLMDLWRTALFIGVFSSERTRVIGVDGKIGPIVGQAIDVLCANGWIPQAGCDKYAAKPWMLAYEVENGGNGWYNFHHHHLHLSLWGVGAKPGAYGPQNCLTPDCSPIAPASHPCAGHAHNGLIYIDLPLPVDLKP